jgi:hypothetical protein
MAFADRFILFTLGMICCLGSTIIGKVWGASASSGGPDGLLLVGAVAFAAAFVGAGLMADASEGYRPARHTWVWLGVMALCAYLGAQAFRASTWEITLPLATLAACPPLVLLHLLLHLLLRPRHQASD